VALWCPPACADYDSARQRAEIARDQGIHPLVRQIKEEDEARRWATAAARGIVVTLNSPDKDRFKSKINPPSGGRNRTGERVVAVSSRRWEARSSSPSSHTNQASRRTHQATARSCSPPLTPAASPARVQHPRGRSLSQRTCMDTLVREKSMSPRQSSAHFRDEPLRRHSHREPITPYTKSEARIMNARSKSSSTLSPGKNNASRTRSCNSSTEVERGG